MSKFKKGDQIPVRFIYAGKSKLIKDAKVNSSSDPSRVNFWGVGVIVGEITLSKSGKEFYPVKIINPPDWGGGDSLGGILSGADAKKGVWISADLVKSASLQQFFGIVPGKTGEKILCPKCGKEMIIIFFSCECPGCGFKTHV